MIKKIKNFFKKSPPVEYPKITLGERDEKGFCDVYADGVKTNTRMLTFTKEEVERLRSLIDK